MGTVGDDNVLAGYVYMFGLGILDFGCDGFNSPCGLKRCGRR